MCRCDTPTMDAPAFTRDVNYVKRNDARLSLLDLFDLSYLVVSHCHSFSSILYGQNKKKKKKITRMF